MAWFRMMGVDSVDYHRRTVVGRDDDHAGSALAYYGTRGETPLVWGGKIAARLGLVGAINDAAYGAIFGAGGATDPVLGTRLVDTSRPGVELVVAAHKSVAVLGVIGRADDMHAMLDAESDATLAFLEAWFERQGGRRGREQTRTQTGGLLWARTRHATSRAGDPAPHDHVLIANVTEMLDARGGWKALDTAALRDLVHAATMAGRMASAAEATRRGYAIAPDAGSSGKLGHWRIAGVPDEACRVLSKRSDQIELELESSGQVGYRARQVAARTSRAPKTDESPDQLLPRWHQDLADAGWPARRIAERVIALNERYVVPAAPTTSDLDALATDALSADGALGSRKVFTHSDIVTAIAPHLYGQDPAILDRAVRTVVSHRDTIPLIGQPGARGRAWTSASVLGTEQAVAEVSRRLARRDGAVVSHDVLTRALTMKERGIGSPLTIGQREAVARICTGGLGLDLIVGTAGSGKTTALDAVRIAFESEGFRVLGAATSGQAARALGTEAEVESRTVASLLYRLQAGMLRLDSRTVLILDEAGMTDDRSMLAVLKAAEHAGTKVVVIGDHRQLSAVGLGGGLESLVGRHADAVHVLDENVRQYDSAERDALVDLRAGKVGRAVDWYLTNDRVVTSPTREAALDAAIDRWHADDTAGAKTLLLAWRRADVADLNERARARLVDAGALTGPEHVDRRGRAFAVGDRVIALAPLNEGAMTTSDRGTVSGVIVDGIRVRTEGGRETVLSTGEVTDHLDYAYALTVHRAQGATVDRTHLVADGGGRELAYVAMSRARESTYVHVVADDVDQAADDLRREWSVERRERWVLDTDMPAEASDRRRPGVAARARDALRAARLRAEHDAVLLTIPPDRAHEVMAAHLEVERVRTTLTDLRAGRGAFSGTEVGTAVREAHGAAIDLRLAEQQQDQSRGWRSRRQWANRVGEARRRLDEAENRLTELTAPIETALTNELDGAESTLREVSTYQADRRERTRGIEISRRLCRLEREIDPPSLDHSVDATFGIEL